jgi:hypothetical protein
VFVLKFVPFSRAGKALLHVATFLRFNKTTGVLRTGEELLDLSGEIFGGDRRNQVRRPDKQSASSHAGS